MLYRRILILLISFTAVLCTFAVGPGLWHPAVLERSLVFSGPDSISKFYRIPALAALADGSLVAVADRRLESNKDLPAKIDVVSRRSIDGGRSWQPAVPVALHDSVGGYGDPALGVDPASGDLVCILTHGSGLWETIPGGPEAMYIYVSRSSDGGLTWSPPYEISRGMYAWNDDSADVKAISAFATSGRLMSDSKGRLWFCLVARSNEKKWSALDVYPVVSTDGGRKWQLIPVSADNNADESKLLELADKSLLMSIRNRDKGGRKFSRSTDDGRSWSPAEVNTTLPDPAINGDILRLPDGRLIHSICDSNNARENGALFISDDSGRTWRKIYEICHAPTAYTAMALLPDGTLGVLSEEYSSEAGQRIWFTRLDINRLINNN